mgnify:CR=1 FL=1
MHSYTGAMSTNRPTPSVQIVAIAATLALVVTTFVIALAAFAAGSYPVREGGSGRPTPAPRVEGADDSVPLAPELETLLSPSVGRGADSRVCATSPSSPRCLLEGGSGLYLTPGGHALRPADDAPSLALLDSERDETGPADMPGRAPGRGGWVGEEGPSRA